MEHTAFSYDVTMFKETFEHEFTYLNGFMRNVHRFADYPAVTCPLLGKTWSYRELNNEVNRLAHALIDEGFVQTDVVMYQLVNSIEFILCYLAPQKIGAINCPINFRLAPGETALIINDSKPKVFVYDSEFKNNVVQALSIAVHKPDKIIMVDQSQKEELPEGHILFEDYVRNCETANPKAIHTPHVYAEVTRLYTSGTTGLPKGVPLNNINEVISAHDVIMHFPLSPKDVTMNMSPWFHRGGLHSGGPVPTLYVGAHVLILRQFNPKICLELTEKYQTTFLIGAPPMLKMLHDQQVKKPADLKSLKGIVTMGAPLEKEACIRFQKSLTPNIYNGYGTSEAFWNTFLRPYDLPEMAGTAGRSCTDDDVAVVKIYPDRRAEPWEHVEKNNQETGEIIVKAPGKTTYAYINNVKDQQRVFYKGWIYIGDLGTWDENEYVTVVGRKDDMIISSGENIHPVQVEEILNEHPKVKESVVVGAPDKLRGEAVTAYIIKADPSLTARELTEYCVNHPMLANYKRPRYYRFVDELPYTSTGKKMHFKVKEQAIKDLEAGSLERS